METIDNLPQHYVYSTPVIEFMTVVAKTCKFLEHLYEFEAKDVVYQLLNYLPLLYQHTIMLNLPEEDFDGYLEQFVTENDYNIILDSFREKLNEHDAYLEIFHENRDINNEPTVAFISENIADIYQEIKDLAGNYQTADTFIMAQAINMAQQTFVEHWGGKLLNALRALHHIHCNVTFDDEQSSHHHAQQHHMEHVHGNNCHCHDEMEDFF